MSASKRIAIAVGISWISRGISIFSGLLLIPILFRFMGKEELGLWFLLGNSQAFLGLLGMGVAPTLTRYIALVKGKSGTELDAVLTQDIQEQLGDLVETGRIVLLCVSVFTFFVALFDSFSISFEILICSFLGI
jgi:O-antigen/teichoic acid export membrane protein